MKPEHIQHAESREAIPSEYPNLKNVAPLLQVMFIRKFFKEQYGKDIRDVESAVRSQYCKAWISANADTARKYIDAHEGDTIDMSDEDAILELLERIPFELVEPADTVH